MKRVSDMGEDALIRELTESLATDSSVSIGPGDDCALVSEEGESLLLKTDTVVEGVHYYPDSESSRVGWKAMARVVSDLAAMGGYARHFLISLALPPDREVAWVKGLYSGLQRCAEAYGGVIVGGETSSLPKGGAAVVTVSATGKLWKAPVTRSGASAGDVVFVTGRLGGSLTGHHLDFQPRVEQAAWLVEHLPPTAMMDVSDGVGQDLPRLAAASGCGYEIWEEALPKTEGCDALQALSDGEDYELLFCVPSSMSDFLNEKWPEVFPELELTAIGQMNGERWEVPTQTRGWEHFSSENER